MIGVMAKPSKHRPKAGSAEHGHAFDPKRIPEAKHENAGTHREAPQPGVPVSQKEYEALKRAAERPTKRVGKRGQDDPSGHK